jgi:transposase
MRSIPLLTETDREQLTALFKYHKSHNVRRRAHSILLSADGFTIGEIVRIYQIHRDTVRTTFDRWEKKGLDGLFDGAKSGRPPKLSPDEAEEAIKLLKEDPRSIKNALMNTKKKRAKKSVSGR